MRNALTIAARLVDATPLVRVVLAAELIATAGILAGGRAPAALLQALQLFLRF